MEEAYPAPVPLSSWTSPLLRHVASLYDSNNCQPPPDVQFNDIYGEEHHRFASAKLPKLAILAVGQELRNRIVDSALHILAQWLRLQPPANSLGAHTNSRRSDLWLIRGDLVDRIVSTNQQGLLCVPALYKAFHTPVSYVLDENGIFSTVEFESAIQDCLLNTPSRKKALKELHSVLQRIAPDLSSIV